MKEKVTVHDSMQKGYTYYRTRRAGDMKDHPEFTPYYTPLQMLRMGVFEGRYLDPKSAEFPESWRKLLKPESDVANNYFGVKSRRSLADWRSSGWIFKEDPRGWFEWYCRFYMGRRGEHDAKQIARWKSFGARHSAQVRKHAPAHGNPDHPNAQKRLKQRQGLLQWAHDPLV
ncbi:hypothetical protein ACFQBQ_13435 [Granulicella cerasi]|uniref:Uncharacterized protein n=1 Tax=Granulicella cerasi TaxID=741063 RepID=A0ABW1ZAQ7_9BACT|nr:hypothetical protein [Granulicella cerasi]